MFSRLLSRSKPKDQVKPKDPIESKSPDRSDKDSGKEPDKDSGKPKLQRSGGKQNLLEQQVSPIDQRKQELEQERDNHTPLIAQQLHQYIIAEADSQIQRFLNSDKAALALREELKRAATAKVEANIDGVDGVTDEEKADAKRYAQEHVEKAGVIGAALRDYTREVVSASVSSEQKQKLQNDAAAGWESVSPNLKTPLQKQVAEAQKQAIKRGRSNADAQLLTLTQEMKASLTKMIQQNDKLLNSSVDSSELLKDAGISEVQQRHDMDQDLVKDGVITTVYDNKLFDPIKQAVLMKLGVGRGQWRRSDELNRFRDKMKQAARTQANEDIDAQLDANALTASKGNAGKRYYGMLAKSEAYATSKESVNKTMENEAIAITKRVLPLEATLKALKTAAQSSAYDVARTQGADPKKIEAAARNAAKIKAIELLKMKQTVAVKEARKITKGDKEANTGPDIGKQLELKQGVQEQVKQDEIGTKAIKYVIESDTMDKGMSKVGLIMNTAAPNPGDSAAFEFELKIPIAQSGAYVLFALGAEAEREPDELTVNAQFTFGAGFTTWGFDANFRAGLYLESQAKDANGVTKLLSYGIYRQIRKLSNKAAETLWGHGGKSGMSKTDEAELWAAMVEQTHMQGDNYVDVGLITKLAADINAGVAELGGEIGYKRLTHYDKETLEEQSREGVGDTTNFDRLKEKAESLGFGANKHIIEAAASAEVKLGDNAVGFELEGAGTILNGRLRELEIGGTASIPFEFGEEGADWAKMMSKIVTPAVGAGKNVVGLIKSKLQSDKEFGSKALGSGMDLGTSIMMTIPEFESVGASLAEKIQGDETVNDTIRELLTGEKSVSAIEKANKILLSSTLDGTISFTKEWDKDGNPDQWEIAFEVKNTKSFEVDAEVVKVGVEKSSRLLKLGLGKGEDGTYGLTSTGFLGFDKEYRKA